MRGIGPVLALAGGCGVWHGTLLLNDGGSLGEWQVSVSLAGGLLLFGAGFFMALSKRGELSRAAVAFDLHACLLGMTAASLIAWLKGSGDMHLGSIVAFIVAAQIVAGFVLLLMAAFAEGKKGAVFPVAVLAYLACTGGAIFLVLRGM